MAFNRSSNPNIASLSPGVLYQYNQGNADKLKAMDKEIAAIQEKSERTVRQHAVSVYRKSGLAGRAELSAFFLEDLLLPVDQEERSGASEAGESAT